MGWEDSRFRSARPVGREPDTLLSLVEQGASRVAGAIGAKTLEMRTKSRLVFYPNVGDRTEFVDHKGVKHDLVKLKLVTTYGHIYVIGGLGERYEAVGGPKAERSESNTGGGHSSEETPAGDYVLGPRHHHTSKNWPMSIIPYGAQLRLSARSEVEYLDNDGRWKTATGPAGTWTQATKNYHSKDGFKAEVTAQDLATFNQMAFESPGKLRPIWYGNDFGLWAWNLRTAKGGGHTGYYVHPVPADDIWFSRGVVLALVGQSHGCIHLHPKDREEMMLRGYLRPGVSFKVMSYKASGPPKAWYTH